MTTTICAQTFDGKHHYSLRRWLGRDAQNKTLDPNDKESWSMVLACVCGKRPSPSAEPALLAALAETQRVRGRRWGVERAAQPKLDL